MVVYMRSMMSLFVFGLSFLSIKEDKVAMFKGGIHISRLMIHAYYVLEDKFKDRDDFRNNRARNQR